MSDCKYLPLISVYHDGELSDERTVDVESHLAHCGDCRAELEQLRGLSSSIADLELPRMPVTSRLRLRRQASVFAVAGRVRFVRMLTAIAASIFIVAGSILAYQQLRPDSENPGSGRVNPASHTQKSEEEKSSEPAVWDPIRDSSRPGAHQ